MKILLFLFACLVSSCATLPSGSYLEGRTGYSKDNGASAKAVIHIPL